MASPGGFAGLRLFKLNGAHTLMKHKVLFVDDEPNILDGYRRNLRKQFSITTATGGEDALALINSEGPFAVIVSDMNMPQMNGVELLTKAKALAPDTVRMMLTGNADQKTAVDAVNEGDVFRFLNKPCPPPEMATALDAACGHYQLLTVEKELLENTLKGSIQAMTEVLSLTNPEAFGRTNRLKAYALKTAQALDLPNLWEIESAAMLCLLGYVSLPTPLIGKLAKNQPLTEEERAAFSKHPAAGAALLANIPRMDQVADSIKYQDQWFDGTGTPGDGVKGADLPVAARILKVVLDYDRYDASGQDQQLALSKMRENAQRYDTDILAAFMDTLDASSAQKIEQVAVAQLAEGMVLAEDVKTEQGMLLVCKGQEITASVGDRLLNFWRNGAIPPKISVYLQ